MHDNHHSDSEHHTMFVHLCMHADGGIKKVAPEELACDDDDDDEV
jgi:hypothetical protein